MALTNEELDAKASELQDGPYEPLDHIAFGRWARIHLLQELIIYIDASKTHWLRQKLREEQDANKPK